MLYMQGLCIQSIISVRSLDNAETNRTLGLNCIAGLMKIFEWYECSLEIYEGRSVEENSNIDLSVTSSRWLEPGMESKMHLQYNHQSTNLYIVLCIILLLHDSWY